MSYSAFSAEISVSGNMDFHVFCFTFFCFGVFFFLFFDGSSFYSYPKCLDIDHARTPELGQEKGLETLHSLLESVGSL